MHNDNLHEIVGMLAGEVSLPAIVREPSVHFKEITVNQMDKSTFYNMPIHGFWTQTYL